MEDEFVGFGGLVEIEIATVWTPVSKVSKVSFAGVKTDVIEILHLNSVNAGKGKEYGANDYGTCSLDLYASQTDPGQLALAAMQLARKKVLTRITYPPTDGFTAGLVRVFNSVISQNGFASLETTAASTYSVELTIDAPGVTDTPPVAGA